VHLHALRTKTVCKGELSSWNIKLLFGNIWSTGCTWSPKVST
jgi:hypothetical protein